MLRLDCPCGEHIEGEDEDDIVAKAQVHLEKRHPDLVDLYGREHILLMAY